MNVKVYNLGLIEYQRAADLQLWLAGQIAAGERLPAMLLLEHPHVYSFGRQGNMDNLLWDKDELGRRGVSIHHSDRGGDVTYHGPGQLVGYPILPLGETGTLEYLRKLEETLIRALAEYGITAGRITGDTGVWIPSERNTTPPAKIASIGVRVDANRITRHGFALNVDPDMVYWQGIIACGLENQTKTSMADWLDPVPGVTEVGRVVVRHFGEVFNCQVEEGELTMGVEDEGQN
jgi:lipoyl(octanoyl) transferase